jgi:hypothetical protein
MKKAKIAKMLKIKIENIQIILSFIDKFFALTTIIIPIVIDKRKNNSIFHIPNIRM